ncbi:hypothetical protein NQ318_012392 [Aromia moschata]|uniref:Transcription initiation factor IIF subunit alpha n=1 Tax=Aromia moschata TaxID=1265417 RepID=A0AAV8Y447_9CUCU|nr:hypothetical protein NQ318_012392 [Aromia moschata]
MLRNFCNKSVNVQEFTIRVPKNVQKRYHVMRFNGTLDVDFAKWSKVSMERENNLKEYKGIEEEMPKFGAGSEFGREAKEEARRKKLGIVARKYRADDQPWILKSYGSTVKKFKEREECLTIRLTMSLRMPKMALSKHSLYTNGTNSSPFRGTKHCRQKRQKWSSTSAIST